MSNKNTPTNKRILANRFMAADAMRSASRLNTPNGKQCTTNDLRRRLVMKSDLADSNNKIQTPEQLKRNSEVLNTAFMGGTVMSPTPASAGTPRFKTKSTTLNACYTPSSLYRSATKSPWNSNGKPTVGSAVKPRPPPSLKSHSEEANTEISNLTVAVRVRPLNSQECTKVRVKNVVKVDDNELTVTAGTNADGSAGVTHSFVYDNVFDSTDPTDSRFADQTQVFAGTARPLIDKAFDGYNACLFAYGQTGSGKSYSMMGIEALDDNALDGGPPHTEAGIIPRFCYELFKRINAERHRVQAEIEISYFEIYNEKIHDLLCVGQAMESNNNSAGNLNGPASSGGPHTPMHQRHALKVREHPLWGPYVVDLSVHPVDSYQALRNWLAVGNSQRATAATGMNDKSSRSHSILNIVLNLIDLTGPSTDSDDGGADMRQARRSKISLVDLAGSERISASGSNCDRIREGVSINKSLLTLGKVIAALAEGKKAANGATAFVPYRESVLTWLLRENLGGNSKTVMLATISPASLHVDETLATLRYACQARSIVNRVKVNESPHDKIIRELRAEVDRLKSLRNEYERQKRLSGNATNPTPRKIIIETSVDESEVDALRQQLAERERELSRAQKSWMERLQEAEQRRQTELRLLKRRGLALELSAEQQQACLINLAADPILSGTLFYILPQGTVKVGRTRTSAYCSQPDIVLDGPLVGYHHCIIENDHGKLFVSPENGDFETYLNGELVTARTQMYHGDRLAIGGSHYFRLSNPFCVRRKEFEHRVIDYQLAHEEVLHKQEEKLRHDLEEEKRAAFARIEMERIENERAFKERIEKLELEQLKFKSNKEILDVERKALESSATKSRDAEPLIYTPSHKSKLLDDINCIMQNPCDESLHKTQLLVKEATQRCRSVGLNMEFHQSQVLDEVGIFRTAVLLVDKENGQKAEWPLARLSNWLNTLRHADNVKSDNIFDSVDVEWQPLDNEADDTLNDTLNSSKISLNLSIVKELIKKPLTKIPQLLTSPKSKSPNSSPFTHSTQSYQKLNHQQQYSNNNLVKTVLLSTTQRHYPAKKGLNFDDDVKGTPTSLPAAASTPPSTSKTCPKSEESFAKAAAPHIRNIQRSTLLLKQVCTHYLNNQENDDKHQRHSAECEKSVYESVKSLENLLHSIRSQVDLRLLMESQTSPTKTPKSIFSGCSCMPPSSNAMIIEASFSKAVTPHLIEMQRSTMLLRKVCAYYLDNWNSENHQRNNACEWTVLRDVRGLENLQNKMLALVETKSVRFKID